MDKESQKYLICPVCFSIFSLDKSECYDIINCDYCEDMQTVLFENFLYYSSLDKLKELRDEFKRSNHLDPDIKDFIIKNIEIVIKIIKEK